MRPANNRHRAVMIMFATVPVIESALGPSGLAFIDDAEANDRYCG